MKHITSKLLALMIMLITVPMIGWAQEFYLVGKAANPIGDEDNHVDFNKAFDGNPETKWCANMPSEGGAYVEFIITPKTRVGGYYIITGDKVTPSNTSYNRNPKGWVLKAQTGLNEEWEVISTVDDNPLPATGKTKVYFDLSPEHQIKEYLCFRLEFSAVVSGPVFEIAEIGIVTCIHEYPEGRDKCSLCGFVREHTHEYRIKQGNDKREICIRCDSEQPHEHEFALINGINTCVRAGCTYTTKDAILTGLSANPEGNNNETYVKLFDGKTTTKWCANMPSEGGAYVEFSSSPSTRVGGYYIVTGHDVIPTYTNYNRNPKGWVLKAKVNESDPWEVISTIDGNPLPTTRETKMSFNLSPEYQVKTYQYFRFEFSAVVAGTVFEIGEIGLETCIHEYPEGRDKCSLCGFVREHTHDYRVKQDNDKYEICSRCDSQIGHKHEFAFVDGRDVCVRASCTFTKRHVHSFTEGVCTLCGNQQVVLTALAASDEGSYTFNYTMVFDGKPSSWNAEILPESNAYLEFRADNPIKLAGSYSVTPGSYTSHGVPKAWKLYAKAHSEDSYETMISEVTNSELVAQGEAKDYPIDSRYKDNLYQHFRIEFTASTEGNSFQIAEITFELPEKTHTYQYACDACSNCGYQRPHTHKYLDDICVRCGSDKYHVHTFTDKSDNCTGCDYVRPHSIHLFDGYACTVCGYQKQLRHDSPVGTIGMYNGREAFVVELEIDGKKQKVAVATENIADNGGTGFSFADANDATKTGLSDGWYVPSKAEMEALAAKLIFNTTRKGAELVIGDNTLFLPAEGYYYGGKWNDVTVSCVYWTCTSPSSGKGYRLDMSASAQRVMEGNTNTGVQTPIRPFCKLPDDVTFTGEKTFWYNEGGAEYAHESAPLFDGVTKSAWSMRTISGLNFDKVYIEVPFEASRPCIIDSYTLFSGERDRRFFDTCQLFGRLSNGDEWELLDDVKDTDMPKTGWQQREYFVDTRSTDKYYKYFKLVAKSTGKRADLEGEYSLAEICPHVMRVCEHKDFDAERCCTVCGGYKGRDYFEYRDRALFDGDIKTEREFSFEDFIDWCLDDGLDLKEYYIYTGTPHVKDGIQYSNLKSWEIYGSQDDYEKTNNNKMTLLATVEDGQLPTTPHTKSQKFTVDCHGVKYKVFRIKPIATVDGSDHYVMSEVYFDIPHDHGRHVFSMGEPKCRLCGEVCTHPRMMSGTCLTCGYRNLNQKLPDMVKFTPVSTNAEYYQYDIYSSAIKPFPINLSLLFDGETPDFPEQYGTDSQQTPVEIEFKADRPCMVRGFKLYVGLWPFVLRNEKLQADYGLKIYNPTIAIHYYLYGKNEKGEWVLLYRNIPIARDVDYGKRTAANMIKLSEDSKPEYFSEDAFDGKAYTDFKLVIHHDVIKDKKPVYKEDYVNKIDLGEIVMDVVPLDVECRHTLFRDCKCVECGYQLPKKTNLHPYEVIHSGIEGIEDASPKELHFSTFGSWVTPEHIVWGDVAHLRTDGQGGSRETPDIPFNRPESVSNYADGNTLSEEISDQYRIATEHPAVVTEYSINASENLMPLSIWNFDGVNTFVYHAENRFSDGMNVNRDLTIWNTLDAHNDANGRPDLTEKYKKYTYYIGGDEWMTPYKYHRLHSGRTNNNIYDESVKFNISELTIKGVEVPEGEKPYFISAPQFAVDGDPTTVTRGIINGRKAYIDFALPALQKVTGYDLFTGDCATENGYKRNPSKWKLYAKAKEADEWILISDHQSGTGLPSEKKSHLSLHVDVTDHTDTDFRLFRFEIDEVVSGDAFEIGEIMLNTVHVEHEHTFGGSDYACTVCGVKCTHPAFNDCYCAMCGYNDGGEPQLVVVETDILGYDNTSADNLVDKDIVSTWRIMGDAAEAKSVVLKSLRPIELDRYHVWTGNNAFVQDVRDQYHKVYDYTIESKNKPREWQLYAKLNEKDPWTLISDVQNSLLPNENSVRSMDYEVQNCEDKKYQYFKLQFPMNEHFNSKSEGVDPEKLNRYSLGELCIHEKLCTVHQYATGSVFCSKCGYMKEHTHTANSGTMICKFCGVDMSGNLQIVRRSEDGRSTEWMSAIPIELNAYTMTTGTADVENTKPKQWILRAKMNEEDDWSLLSVVENGNLPNTAATESDKFYTFNDEHMKYRYVKLDVLAVGDGEGTDLKMGDVRFFSTKNHSHSMSGTSRRCADCGYVASGHVHSESSFSADGICYYCSMPTYMRAGTPPPSQTIVDRYGNVTPNFSWELNLKTGALKIIGSGDMTDYRGWGYWFQAKDFLMPYCNYTKMDISFSEGITHIAPGICKDADFIRTATLPSTVKSIGSNAFCNCGITEIDLPESLGLIDVAAFSNVPLSSIKLPEKNPLTIRTDAFYNTRLNEVRFPKNTKQIEYDAFCIPTLKNVVFDHCDPILEFRLFSSAHLESVTVLGRIPGFDVKWYDEAAEYPNNIFDYVYYTGTLNIPITAKYWLDEHASSEWNKFHTINVISNFEQTDADGGQSLVYLDNKHTVSYTLSDEVIEKLDVFDDFIAPCITYERSISDQNWHPLVLPFDYVVAEEDLTQFDVARPFCVATGGATDGGMQEDDDLDVVILDKYKAGDKVPAYLPLFIRKKSSGSSHVTIIGTNAMMYDSESKYPTITCSTTEAEYEFISQTQMGKPEDDTTWYAMENGMLHLGSNDSHDLPALRWYMTKKDKTAGASSRARAIRVMALGDEDDEEVNSISDVYESNRTSSGQAIYSISGVRLSKPQKGLNIIDGKKVVIK